MGCCSSKRPTSGVGGVGVFAVVCQPPAVREDWYSVDAAEVAPQQPPMASQLTALPALEFVPVMPGPTSWAFLSSGVTCSYPRPSGSARAAAGSATAKAATHAAASESSAAPPRA